MYSEGYIFDMKNINIVRWLPNNMSWWQEVEMLMSSTDKSNGEWVTSSTDLFLDYLKKGVNYGTEYKNHVCYISGQDGRAQIHYGIQNVLTFKLRLCKLYEKYIFSIVTFHLFKYNAFNGVSFICLSSFP